MLNPNNPNLVRVVAAVVDIHNLTLYTEEGNTIVIPQGDIRVAPIVRIVTPICAAGNVAEVDLSTENFYSAIESKSNGLVKLFRVARNKLAAFFATSNEAELIVPPMEIGNPARISNLQAATEEIMKHAVSVSDPMFTEKDLHVEDKHQENANDGDTVIAVVNNRVLPDAHKIKAQIQHAVATDNPVALANFIERSASSKGRHTMEELMRFMQRGDLPIANDGSIVIYKILRKKKIADHEEFDYVDCHTGKVPQSVGSYVYMDASLVDPNRGQECSNGLHVARRAYLSGFTGDVVVIAKVSPEDVIAVPTYDSNKMRVCGYHILYELNSEDFAELKANRPIRSSDGKKKLANAISGDHVTILTYVKIGAHGGADITKKAKPVQEQKAALKAAQVTDATPEISAIQHDVDYKAESVDPKLIAQDVQAVKSGAPSRAEQARALYIVFKEVKNIKAKADAAAVLIAFKKSKKVSWDSLGITSSEVEKLNR